MRIYKIVLSWDFAVALALTIATAKFCPRTVPMAMAKDFYSVGVSVLSIVFSVFFAALAIIMSAGDNDFVAFLHEDGSYSQIVWSFRFTVSALFLSLVVALTEYAYVGFRMAHKAEWHSKWFLVVFVACFSYSLLAVALSVHDAIKYSSVRVRYLNLKQ
ncbi:MAG: hypothetical protein ACLQMO_00035 [Acidobacteriaceae bacterium]